ncbi:MAG: VWA domain-containing protein [Oscillospiraceae bacterium]|nr:VWA domain-containing protein [Oscillospiraceae bacterium]
MELKYPYNTAFIALAAAAAVFYALSFRKKEKIMAQLHLDFKMPLAAMRSALVFFGLALAAFSLSGPQVFTGYSEAGKTGLDIYVLMDTSKSMLVSDIKPNRLAMAKKIAENLIYRLDGDRIGFIPFASDAYVQMPLTDDYQLAQMFLSVMDTDMISGGGTNLAAAIKLANDSFKRTSSADMVIIILSDGEESGDASVKLLQNIAEPNLKVYAIGIGTEMGGLVPVYNNSGETIVDYMKDGAGNPVTSRLCADTLIKLAKEGGGSYYRAGLQGIEISSLVSELSELKRYTSEMEKTRRFAPLYQYFLGGGMLMFLAGWFLQDKYGGSK